MTRINAGIHPRELPNKQLLAEHREITRIPNAVRKKKVNLHNLPSKFTLNTGHVRFFYNKLGYLHLRYAALYDECVRRGFAVTCKATAFENIPASLYGSYKPTKEDRNIIIERITSKGFDLLKVPENIENYAI